MCWSPLKTPPPGDTGMGMVDCFEPEAEGWSRDREKQSHRERQKESSQKVRDRKWEERRRRVLSADVCSMIAAFFLNWPSSTGVRWPRYNNLLFGECVKELYITEGREAQGSLEQTELQKEEDRIDLQVGKLCSHTITTVSNSCKQSQQLQ